MNSAGLKSRGGLLPVVLLLVIAIPWIVLGVPRDPDESRYLEIPREMAASGDWVVPRLDGLPYLEKPPLYYWVMAALFTAFGPSELAGRAVSFFCAAGMVFLTVHAGNVIRGRRVGTSAGAVLATSPFFAALASIITIDLLFSFLVTAAMVGFFHGVSSDEDPPPRRQPAILLAYACLGLAILTKGPVACVFPALAWLSWRCLRGRGPVLPPAFMAGSSILLCITLPWFLAVTWKFPSFPEYFILDQHLMRFAGRDVPGLRFHDQSPLFFLPIILGGAFPWSPYLAAPWRTLWREVRTEPLARFAWSWLLPSLAFFSISSGKLPTYVLPLFPPMALLVARRWDDIAAGSVSRLFSLGLSAVVLGAGIIASVVVILLVIFRGEENYFVLLDRRLVTILVVVAISFPAASFVALRTGNASRAFTVLVSMGVPVMLLGAFFKVNLDREASTEAIALHVKDARRPGEKVICAGEYLPLISFQLAEPIFVYGSESELVFGAANPEGCCDPLVDLDRLRSWVRGPDRVFVIIQEKKRQRLETKLGKSLYLLAKEGRHVLVSNASAPSTPGAPEDEE